MQRVLLCLHVLRIAFCFYFVQRNNVWLNQELKFHFVQTSKFVAIANFFEILVRIERTIDVGGWTSVWDNSGSRRPYKQHVEKHTRDAKISALPYPSPCPCATNSFLSISTKRWMRIEVVIGPGVTLSGFSKIDQFRSLLNVCCQWCYYFCRCELLLWIFDEYMRLSCFEFCCVWMN